MRRFFIALQFLTIFPVKIKSEIKQEDFGKSLKYFPIVGILIGILLSLTLFIFGFLPSMVKGVIILMVSIIITNGMHLDGFADTCDGFYGNRPKEKILEIMRDSRIGVMGVIGIALLLLLKFTLIINIPSNILWKSLIAMSAFARWSQALACYKTKYARQNGKAKFFVGHATCIDIVVGGIIIIALFIMSADLRGLAIVALAIMPVVLFIIYCRGKIGGMTGDTIGAVNEIAEVSALFFSLILTSLSNG